jgi:hypothetical protein
VQPIALQLNNISFCHPEPASLAGEESVLARQKQIPRAIKPHFGMANFSGSSITYQIWHVRAFGGRVAPALYFVSL